MLGTVLNVSFQDKDRAKALGARWDPLQKKWYVPENIALERFAEWLPSNLAPHIALSLELAINSPLQKSELYIDTSISLSQLLSQVSQAISRAIPSTVWLRCEISDCHSKANYFYLDLAELDANHQLLCKAKAIIFKNRLGVLMAKFETATGGFLKPGMKVLLQVKANFNILHGLSLSVKDIDPNYTLGDMAAKLATIREKLKKERLYNRNKQLNLPKDFTRIAVISPDMAAGLGDFQREATKLENLNLCHFQYYTAQFQGTIASNQIIAAVEAVIQDHSKHSFDALVILRGGGAAIDLAWLNEYALAKKMCTCPLVVFTGIGHERDNTILDEVANLRFDTPSKVIAYVFNRITENSGMAIRHANEIATESHGLWSTMQHNIFKQFTFITHKAEYDIHHTQRTMEQWYHQSFQQAKSSLTLVEANLINGLDRILESSQVSIYTVMAVLKKSWQYFQEIYPVHIIQAENQITVFLQQLKSSTFAIQMCAEKNLKNIINALYQDSAKSHLHMEQMLTVLMSNVIGLGPNGTLKRGYALIRDPEKRNVITSEAESVALSFLEIQFHDGSINVRLI
jgi:exodeoxyribonuclease VII large subunit